MRRLLLVPALAVAVTAAVTVPSAGAGDQRTSLGGGVSVVLPAGWHLTHGKGTSLSEPFPRLSAATFAVHFSGQHCVCDTPRVADFPRDGAYLLVFEWPLPRGRRANVPAHPPHFRIGHSRSAPGTAARATTGCFARAVAASRSRSTSAPTPPPPPALRSPAILDSWRVT